MTVNNVSVCNHGFIHCRSAFYTAHCVLNEKRYDFKTGTYKLIGEIDSEAWSVSYLLSMCRHKPKDFVLFGEPCAVVNGQTMNLKELSKYSCYMDDKLYPLFSKGSTVKKLIAKGIAKSQIPYTMTDIKELFCLSNERFDRSICRTGVEVFKAMAAVGFAYGKDIYCFPWLSDRHFQYYGANIETPLKTLEQSNKICIVPIGKVD